MRLVVIHFFSESQAIYFRDQQKGQYEAYFIFDVLLQITNWPDHRPLKHNSSNEPKLAMELLASMYPLPTTPPPWRNKLKEAVRSLSVSPPTHHQTYLDIFTTMFRFAEFNDLPVFDQ